MKQFNISQMPVHDNGKIVGSLSDHNLFNKIIEQPELKELPVKNVMEAPFKEVSSTTSIDDISKLFSKDNRAVIVNLEDNAQHIITFQDIIEAIGK